MDQIFDTSLVEQAKAGDQQAFAELYTRWYDPVYDFVARMTRDRDEAADIAQDTSFKAMNALGGLQAGASFKSWIFTIARNTALNRIEKAKRLKPLVFEDSEGDEVSLDVVDTDRFGSPEEAAEAKAMASLVWEAAAGLDPRQHSLVDLHLRQGLDSAEIADVLGVTKNNGYVMLNRLKKAVEDAIGAFIMFKDGRRYCDDLDALLAEARIEGMSPDVRKLVDCHVAQCDICEEKRKKLVSPLAVFGAFAAVGVPPGVKAHTLEGLMREWPGAAARAGGGQPPDDSALGSFPGDDELDRPKFGERFKGAGKYVVGGGIAAMFLLGAFLVPASPLSLFGEDGTSAQQASDDRDGSGKLPAAGGVSTATPTKTPAKASPTPSPTKTAGAGAATALGASQTPTRTSTPRPGTPTPTQTSTVSPTSTGTATATATATPTTPRCSASISTNIGSINVPPVGSSSFLLLASCSSSTFTISGGDGWATASPSSGTVTFGNPPTIQVSVDASSLSEGPHSTTLTIQGQHNSTSVVVSTNVPGASPSVSVFRVSCSPTSSTFAIGANVSDDFRVSSVIVRLVIGGTPSSYTLTGPDGAASGVWERDISGVQGVSSWTVIATDGVGKTGTASGTC